MKNEFSPLLQLKEFFFLDTSTLYYHGGINDSLTDNIISIADHDFKKKNRIGFLITESFQNIIRHGNDDLSSENQKLFGIRIDNNDVHIFSSNPIDQESKEKIKSKLNLINSLNKEELRAYSLEALRTSEISDAGGAGLGFLEMVKKSKHPVQFGFTELSNETNLFNLQIDFQKTKVLENDREMLRIKENAQVIPLITEKKVQFFYKGEFSDELMQPILAMMEKNLTASKNFEYSIFHVCVELMQNITRHTINDDKFLNQGILIIQNIENGYFVATGNYIEGDGQAEISKIENINSKSGNELDKYYRETLKKSILNESNNAGVGAIDLKRITGNNIRVDSMIDEKGRFLTIGVKITENGKNN